jgi:hypothetical protein
MRMKIEVDDSLFEVVVTYTTISNNDTHFHIANCKLSGLYYSRI